jgi:hypothetical protein
MTSKIAKKAGMKVFERHLEQYTPKDPLYEFYTDANGKQRRRKRELPPGLSKRDAAILTAVKRRAHYLDKGFTICGFRFGWTFIIALVPGLGDIVDAGLNYFLVVRKCKQAEIPGWLLSKMLANNAISAAVSFIPLIGDVILAQFRANSRNAALLEEFLRVRGEEFLAAQQGQAAGPNAAIVHPGAGAESGERIPVPAHGQAVSQAQVPVGEHSGTGVPPPPPQKKKWGWFGRKTAAT